MKWLLPVFFAILLACSTPAADIKLPDWRYFPTPQVGQVKTLMTPGANVKRSEEIAVVYETDEGNLQFQALNVTRMKTMTIISTRMYLLTENPPQVLLLSFTNDLYGKIDYSPPLKILDLPLIAGKRWDYFDRGTRHECIVIGDSKMDSPMGGLDCKIIQRKRHESNRTVVLEDYYAAGLGYVGGGFWNDEGQWCWLDKISAIKTPGVKE